jgi:hypothetical protein
MNAVKVNRQELLTKVRANRAAHRELFLKAQEDYRKLVVRDRLCDGSLSSRRV